MAGPLDGIRVIDLTSMISGPVTTLILADQGADVIKVENPNGGDFTRAVSTRRNEMSASFVNNNRNKRSIALDLKSDRGRELLLELARDADVFVQNFRPGVVDRMGIGEADIREVSPAVIYVSISGFGHEGPYAQKPVYDPLIQALSGLTTIQGGADSERPRLVRTIVPDKLTGFAGSQAITAALVHKLRTGEGQHIRLSMLDTLVSFLWYSDMGSQTFVGHEVPQAKAQSFIDLIYETSDGYISVAVQSDKEWRGLCTALGHPEWLEDPRFGTPALRHEHIDERLALTQSALHDRSSAHWLAKLEAADVPCAPILSRHEMISHPQVQANDILMEYDHPQAGRLRQARNAPKFSATPSDLRHPAPGLGENGRELLESIGLAADAIDELVRQGVVRVP